MAPRSDLGCHPAVVAYVCSRWRKVALSVPWLWRYINIPFIHKNADVAPMSRGLAFANRTSALLLDVLFYTESGCRSAKNAILCGYNEYRETFVNDFAPWTHSLELVFNSGLDFIDCYYFLSEYIMNCLPEELEILVISCRDISNCNQPGPIFIHVPGTLPGYLSECQDFPAVNLGPVLESLTVLQLRGVYPVWTSEAYRNLIELRLANVSWPPPRKTLISEEHLQGILKASPGLRIFQISIGIAEPVVEEADVAPVPLNCLEVLVLVGLKPDLLGTFLRWLSPGTEPLRLAIPSESRRMDGTTMYSSHSQVVSFFSRPNIASIYSDCDDRWNIVQLFPLCPRLHTLALYQIDQSEFSWSIQPRFQISHLCVELFIGKSDVKKEALLDMVGESSTLKSVLFSDSSVEPGCIDELKAETGIPDIRQVDYDPARDHWEGLDSWLRR